MEISEKKPVGLTGRYVNALYQLCSEKNILQNVVRDFNSLKELFLKHKNFSRLILSPTIGKKKKILVISDLLKKAKANDITINFCRVLGKNGRISILNRVIDEFLFEVSRRKGEIEVEVFTAHKLDKDEQTELKNLILNKINGKTVSLFTHVDHSLLGGLILKIGSKMIDNSLKTKLKNLEMAMKGES